MATEILNSQLIKTADDLGQVVRHYRKAKGLKQDTVASLSGVSTGFLSNFENGKPTAEIGKVLQVLQTLGLDLHVIQRNNQPVSGFGKLAK